MAATKRVRQSPSGAVPTRTLQGEGTESVQMGRVKFAGKRPFSPVDSLMPISQPSSCTDANPHEQLRGLPPAATAALTCSSGSSYSMTRIISPLSKFSSSTSSAVYLYVARTCNRMHSQRRQ